MGTRGIVGFVVDGRVKAGYNHWDSDPGWLGLSAKKFVSNGGANCVEDVRRLRVVESDSVPTPEDVQALSAYLDDGVGGPMTNGQPSWYQLLRHTQGDLEAMLAAGVIEDSADFAADSLFCEWGYLVNYDTEMLEVYQGFQQATHSSGRFATATPESNRYFPIKLIGEIPFTELAAMSDTEFVERMDPPDEDEDD